MNVYKKLTEARCLLLDDPVIKGGTVRQESKATGKVSTRKFFAMADFIPKAQRIFKQVGLCGVVSFTKELASIRIFDVENAAEFVEMTAPFGSANLFGCHEVQNIGATMTYQRRYLWMTALEIAEHDEAEETPPQQQQKQKQEKPKAPPTPAEASKQELRDIVKKLGMTEAVFNDITGVTFTQMAAFNDVAAIDDVIAKLKKWEETKPTA